MANLIITVISIALVAVAALMGAYYGGSAFMDGQKKAWVNQVVNAMVQTEGAYNLCIASEPNGSTETGPCRQFDQGNGDLMSKKYLSSNPMDQICNGDKFGCEENSFGFNSVFIDNSALAPGFYFQPLRSGDTTPAKAKNSLELCKAIAKRAGGETAVPRLAVSGILPAAPVYKMDCTFDDQDSDGVASVGDNLYIYHKF